MSLSEREVGRWASGLMGSAAGSKSPAYLSRAGRATLFACRSHSCSGVHTPGYNLSADRVLGC